MHIDPPALLAPEASPVVAAARRWLGVPWRHQGRGPRGVDCAGLVILAAREAGHLDGWDFTAYGRHPDGGTLQALCDEWMARIPRQAAAAGDVLLMRWVNEPQHLAIVTEIGIIHAYAQARRVVEHRLDATWTARIVQAYRLEGRD